MDLYIFNVTYGHFSEEEVYVLSSSMKGAYQAIVKQKGTGIEIKSIIHIKTVREGNIIKEETL